MCAPCCHQIRASRSTSLDRPRSAASFNRGWKPLPQDRSFLSSSLSRRHRREGGLRRKAHPEHLPSFTDRVTPRPCTTAPPRAAPPNLGKGVRHKAQGKKLIPGPRPLTPAAFMARPRLGVAPLQSRPPCPEPPNRGWPVPSPSSGYIGRNRTGSREPSKSPH
jgi:hypothetical protein